MKYYYLFAGDWHYPGGGLSDYIGHFVSVEDARRFLETKAYDWAEIVTTDDSGGLVNVEYL